VVGTLGTKTRGCGVADALVSRERLFYGDLPEVCAKTGEPTSAVVSTTFERLPPWTFLLLFAGIFPFFIAVLFVREKVKAKVPMTAEVVERYHGRRRWLVLGYAVIALALIVTVALQEPRIMTAGLIGVVMITVTEYRRARDWISAVGVRDTPFVELRRVHPAFVAAVETHRPERTTS
jgi:hypothetical protein